jgi:divalent metal cation (Fe/Co/Zn/Cd) transporter
MTDLDRTLVSKRERTMLISFLISSAAPIVTGVTAIISRSATQIADFLRRTAELTSLFISWWVYRKLHKEAEYDDIYRVRMERIADITVLGAMVCSGVAMLVVGISRLFIYKISGSVITGLMILITLPRLMLIILSPFSRRVIHIRNVIGCIFIKYATYLSILAPQFIKIVKNRILLNYFSQRIFFSNNMDQN